MLKERTIVSTELLFVILLKISHMEAKNNSDQKFRWPETKNPALIIIKLLGRSTIFLVIAAVYVVNQFGTIAKILFWVIFNFFLLSMGWVFLQQKLKVYKLLGWAVIFSSIWLTLVELFPDMFAITR